MCIGSQERFAGPFWVELEKLGRGLLGLAVALLDRLALVHLLAEACLAPVMQWVVVALEVRNLPAGTSVFYTTITLTGKPLCLTVHTLRLWLAIDKWIMWRPWRLRHSRRALTWYLAWHTRLA